MAEHIDSPVGAGGTMGGRNIVSLLLNEARTKPQIAELVRTVPGMTAEEFEAVQTPLPWYKKALGELRRIEDNKATIERAQSLVDRMGEPQVIEPSRGFVVRYTGVETHYTPPSRHKGGRPLPLLIKTGDLLFVTREETWLGSLPMGFPNIPCEVVERDVERRAYFGMIDRNNGFVEPQGTSRRASTASGVQFSIQR